MIVHAAEDLFVPVCVYNNTRGDEDARVLKSFKEPAWNNPVVRILDPETRKDLAGRIADRADQWTVRTLVGAMTAALEKMKRGVPGYLALLAAEEASRMRGPEKAVFGMG